MLKQLDRELNGSGVRLAFAELRGRLQGRVPRYGLHGTIKRDHFYAILTAALAAFDALGSQGRP